MSDAELEDDFPQSPARRAVVAVVRGYGALNRQMSPYYSQFGLTPPQFQMLTVLNRLQGQDVTQRRLAHELYVSFPNITVMLSRLEEAGYIDRTTSEADRRAKIVTISRRGKNLLRRIWKQQPGQLARVTAGLNDDECDQLARLLGKFIAGQNRTQSPDRRPDDLP